MNIAMIVNRKTKMENKSTWSNAPFGGLKSRLQGICDLFGELVKLEEQETTKKIKELTTTMEAVAKVNKIMDMPAESLKARIIKE